MSESDRPDGAAPVPVRELLQSSEIEAAEGTDAADVEASAEGIAFDMEGEPWAVRVAGAGLYGTGDRGGARLLALHFYRPSAPDLPVREVLVPAAVVGGLWAAELRALFEAGTPIDLDREQR